MSEVIERNVVHRGECVAVMGTLPANCVDAVVTDPPYHLTSLHERYGQKLAKGTTHPVYRRHTRGFMGKTWDGGDVAFDPATWAAALRVAKPGAHLVAFGGTRTYHRLACAVEDAGWEIRDCLHWLYGSGFPKSRDIGKAIDTAAGADREVIPNGARARRMIPGADQNRTGSWVKDDDREYQPGERPPVTDAARAWDGWGTALKPAVELIVLARKPVSERNVAANVLAHSTGAVNIDGCRIGTEERADHAAGNGMGRWPANVVLSHSPGCIEVGRKVVRSDAHYAHGRGADGVIATGLRSTDASHDSTTASETVVAWECAPDCAVRLLDEQSGERKAGGSIKGDHEYADIGYHGGLTQRSAFPARADSGGASRFFYTAKADAAERSAGLATRNTHPTVKPLALMAWLVTLVTPPGGVVLDPFLGSGTTAVACIGNGFDYVGIEQEADSVDIALQRIGLGARLAR